MRDNLRHQTPYDESTPLVCRTPALKCGESPATHMLTRRPDWVIPFLKRNGPISYTAERLGLDASTLQKIARGERAWISLHVLDPLAIDAGEPLPDEWYNCAEVWHIQKKG